MCKPGLHPAIRSQPEVWHDEQVTYAGYEEWTGRIAKNPKPNWNEQVEQGKVLLRPGVNIGCQVPYVPPMYEDVKQVICRGGTTER